MNSRIRFALACSGAALLAVPIIAQQPASTPAKDTPNQKAVLDAEKAKQPVEKKEPNRGGDIDLASQDPAVAQQRFTVQEGYEISLFASEKEFPELAKPVAFNFDDRGRLWVSTLPSYPHYLPGEAPRDKIIILEDTDNDGKADKSSTFADDLYLPTGFELGDGGVYVGLQPFLAFLKDTDGDGKADTRDYLLHGFGTEDSHHAVHAFQWGPEGGLYFHEGIFHNTQVETPYGRVQLKDAGVFRFDPLRHHFSIFVSYGFANPWGHVWNRWGSNFIADASGGSNYYGSAISGDLDFPYKHPNMKVFTSVVRPTAGCELVASRHFPQSAQGNFLVNNCIGFQGIKQHQVIEEGSGYTSKEIEPLLQSSDPNFRPVAIQFGPDGALYIVDWWNPLIGHMQYSLRDPRRDKAHGRIWRITAKGRPLLAKPKIAGATIAQKLDLLKEYEDRTRYRARISLREHPAAEVKGEIARWVAALDANHKDHEHHLLEALWATQTIGEPDVALLKQLLLAKDYQIRSGATRALRFFLERASGERVVTNEDAIALLAKQVLDTAPRVRLEALLTLSFIRQPEAAAVALEALKKETDYYLDYVLQETISTLEPNWKPVLLSGKELANDNAKGLDYLLARLSTKDLVGLARTSTSLPIHIAVLSRGGVTPEDRRASLQKYAGLSNSTPLHALVNVLDQASGDARKELVQMLLGWPPQELGSIRDRIQTLALNDADAGIRQAAWVTLMRADGDSAKAWELASRDRSKLIDLLDSTAQIKDANILSALYPKVQQLATAGADEAAGADQPVIGRFVRVEHPARSRTLTLAEVQVFSRGENVALKGKARQSSVAFGGTPERAIDGRTDGNFSAGTSTHTIEMEEFPWWEVDLGAEKDLDRIVVWNRTDGTYAARLNNFKVSVLDGQRKEIWSKDSIPTPMPTVALEFGGSDPNAATRRSALAALSRIPGHDTETFETLVQLILAGKDVQTAITAIQRLPKASWPVPKDARLVAALKERASKVPAENRDAPAYRQLIDLGATLARKGGRDQEAVARELEAFLPQTFTIKTVEAQMKYDITRIYVEAGRPVRITLENPDVMQHNLVVMQPGAREEVGKQADAMGADGFKAQFVPKNDKILFATKLVDPKKSEALSFTAPEKPADYEYVCTFPGHWIIMWGKMTVVPKGDPRAGKVEMGANAGDVRPGNF
jgi:azurin/glucose/arabinose dehydrogenase